MKSLISEVVIEQYPKLKSSLLDEGPTQHKVIQKGSGLNIYLQDSMSHAQIAKDTKINFHSWL